MNLRDFMDYIIDKYGKNKKFGSIKTKKNVQYLFRELVDYAINNDYTVEYNQDPDVLYFCKKDGRHQRNLDEIAFSPFNQVIRLFSVIVGDKKPIKSYEFTYTEQDLEKLIGKLPIKQKCYLALYGVPV